MLPPRLFVVAALAVAVPSLQAAAPASGTVDDWTVVDAIAWKDDSGTHVVFSDKAFDRAAIAGDRTLDTFDVMRHQMSPGNGQTYEIRLDPDGSLGGVSVSMPGGSSVSYSSDMAAGLVVSTRGEGKVAGSFNYQGAAVRFDLPIVSGPLALPGKPLPADGGDPGKVLLAQVKAIEAGDFDALLKLSPPEHRASMQAGKGNARGAMEMAAAKAFTPTRLSISGGQIDGDQAWIDFSGRMDGKPVTGTAQARRVDGTWYVGDIAVNDPD